MHGCYLVIFFFELMSAKILKSRSKRYLRIISFAEGKYYLFHIASLML